MDQPPYPGPDEGALVTLLPPTGSMPSHANRPSLPWGKGE
jgi:hypothetical protein